MSCHFRVKLPMLVDEFIECLFQEVFCGKGRSWHLDKPIGSLTFLNLAPVSLFPLWSDWSAGSQIESAYNHKLWVSGCGRPRPPSPQGVHHQLRKRKTNLHFVFSFITVGSESLLGKSGLGPGVYLKDRKYPKICFSYCFTQSLIFVCVLSIPS